MTAPYETDLEHPTESELADLALGGLDETRSSTIAGHLRACVPCRILADRLGRGLPELPAGEPPGGVDSAIPEAARGQSRPPTAPGQGRVRVSSGGCAGAPMDR